MAFEIVDGRTGNPHISSEDLACFNEAIIGESNCVFEWGNEFACTMSDANTATVASGAGMVGGKRFWNQASTNVTIQSGTQGQNRNDLIVARYDITDDGIESITPKVIKGTATTGTATDPSVTDDDLPLYRIPLSGISVGQPVKLFEPIQSITSFRDSISHVLYENEQGVKGAITLSDSAANYDYLEFFWKHDDGMCGSQRIADPNGKTIGINSTSATNYGYLWFAYKGINISGTQCTLNTNHAVGELGFTNDGTLQRQKQDKLGITKVIGYKLS